MSIISIDVGIKNLSYCVFATTHGEIRQWAVVNLMTPAPAASSVVRKCTQCSNRASYVASTEDLFVCKKHVSHHFPRWILPDVADFTRPCQFKSMKLPKLQALYVKYKDPVATPPPLRRADFIDQLSCIYDRRCFRRVDKPHKQPSAAKYNLVDIGKNIQSHFDQLPDIDKIQTVLIENQIGPIASKMKTIQGMIAQYFIMKLGANVVIEFVNASNKLKVTTAASTPPPPIDGGKIDGGKGDYKHRKKASIFICETLLNEQPDTHRQWIDMWKTHAKKDDLADCYLQGMWYISRLRHP